MPSTPQDQTPAPTIIARADHNVSRKHVSRAALKVLYRLHESGYQAFLVGGAVRDLLLDGRPKDFDVATDAEPDQVHALFRNSRVIGRRFRLVHVRFGREIIEVATFRAASNPDEDDSGTQTDDEGRLVRDNQFGSIDEDVWRRDFTANALYYNIADFSVWDYVGGARDIGSRRLRLIGEPARRLREDPVRVLRALRFVAKLGFTLEPELEKAIASHKSLLDNVPAARLFDEFLKMFQAGFGLVAYDVLRDHGVFGVLFPQARMGLDAPDGEFFDRFIRRALKNTDERIAADKPVTPMFLLAVFLWWPIKARARALYEDDGLTPAQSLGQATYQCVAQQQSVISVPKRFTIPLREMLTLQPRFERMRGTRAAGFLAHKRFRAAYDFMLLRNFIGEVPDETAAFWTEVQTLSVEARAERFEITSKKLGDGTGQKRRRRRRRRTRKPDVPGDEASS
ncbi:MAG: polynucleotide adenylyltransferase PcnB [Pseudomonadota bacterium]